MQLRHNTILKIILLFLFMLFTTPVTAQKKLVKLFRYTHEYFHDTAKYSIVAADIKETFPNDMLYIKIFTHNIESAHQYNIGKHAKTPWAIKIEDDTYCNLYYFWDRPCGYLFIKPHTIGKHTIYIATIQTMNILINKTFHGYAGGAVPHVGNKLEAHSVKWGNAWKWSKTDKSFILYSKTGPMKYKTSNAYWSFLTKSSFNDLIGTSLSNDELDQFTPETLIQFIEDKNKESIPK